MFYLHIIYAPDLQKGMFPARREEGFQACLMPNQQRKSSTNLALSGKLIFFAVSRPDLAEHTFHNTCRGQPELRVHLLAGC